MIVITAPTGRIGRQVLDTVLAAGEQARVIVRDPARLSAAVRERVEVVPGSHGDSEIVDRAFAGAAALFWLVPPDQRTERVTDAYIEFSRPASAAIARHGVKQVVTISALGRGTPWAGNAGLVTASLQMEDLISNTGVDHRVLSMPSFMDNILWQVASIKSQGGFFWPIASDRQLPTVATRDIAAVAARYMLDRTWTGQESVPVLGPEDLSGDEMAAIISAVLGRPVRCQHVPGAAYKASLVGTGMSAAFAQGMLDMVTAKEAGLDSAVARTAETATPTTFRQWAEDALLPAVRA